MLAAFLIKTWQNKEISMANQPVSVAGYYAANKAKEKEYVQVYAARAVGPGDRVTLDTPLGVSVQQSVREKGYELSAYSALSSSCKTFVTEEKFAAGTEPADQLPPATPRVPMSEEEQAALTPVARGERIFVNAFLPVITDASYDGFILSAGDDKKIYLSNYELTAMFNNVSGRKNTHADLVVRLTDEPAVKGIVLKEAVLFDFKDGPHEAPAGSFLYENADDPDGYTVKSPEFSALSLRQAKPDLAPAVKTAADVKVGGPLKLKRKP
jgi:hypothetical protein